MLQHLYLTLCGSFQSEREREGKLKEFDLRYSSVPSPRDNDTTDNEFSLHGSPKKSPRHCMKRENTQLVWDRRRRTAWETMQEDKLISAYGPVQSPHELALLSHGSRPGTHYGC